MTGSTTRPASVDDYLGRHRGAVAALLHDLRGLRDTAGIETVEAIKWGCPAILHPSGTILYTFSAHKDHANIFFTPSTRAAFEEQLAGFTTGKGRVALRYGEQTPLELLRHMVAFRVREFEEHGVKWM